VIRGLTGRIVAAGVILLLLVGGGFAGLLLAIAELRSADVQVTRSATELRAASQIERLLVDMETGLRGFVLTHEETFLEPWNEGRDAFPREVNALAPGTDDPTQTARLRAIAAAGGAYIEQYGLPLIAQVRSGDPAAASVATTERGKQRVDELRSLLSDFTEAERQTYIARQDEAEGRAGTATRAATIAVAGSVGLIGLFIVYLARTLVRPVTGAARMAGRLAAGDLATRMPETGTAEIGMLERSFNSLAASLEESTAAQRRLLDQQSALRRVATLVAEGRPSEDIFSSVVAELTEQLPSEVAVLGRFEADETVTFLAGWVRGEGPAEPDGRLPLRGDSVASRVWRTRTTARMDSSDIGSGPIAEAALAREVRSSVACPIVVAGQLWGMLAAGSRNDNTLPADAEIRMAAFTELVGTALANAAARGELAASRARIVTASDDTRRRIERNLHDGAQQRLVSLGLRLRMLESAVRPDEDEVKAEILHVAGEVTGVIDELREISRGIYPASLARGGLASAVRTLARRSPLPIELDITTEAQLTEPVQAAGYYVVAEAVTNAAKHAAATVVRVTLEDRDRMLRVAVHDDGVGGADPGRGSGLTGLRDRVEALGGRLEITSPSGEGTLLVAEIPTRQTE
jgi:signal transduction histidine kinase